MKKKQITIPIDEYEHLLMMENLTHKQRFTIAFLNRELEKQKVKASRFSKKVLDLLLNSGYSIDELIIYFTEVKDANIK